MIPTNSSDLIRILSQKDEEIMRLSEENRKLLEDNKQLSSYIHKNCVSALEDLKISKEKNKSNILIEFPTNSQELEDLIEKKIKEFKSKIKDLALEIEKQKQKNAILTQNIEEKIKQLETSEEKIVLLTTEIQRLNTQSQNYANFNKKLEDKLKDLCNEVEKREKNQETQKKTDEIYFKEAIANTLKFLKEFEEKFSDFRSKIAEKYQKLPKIKENIEILTKKLSNIRENREKYKKIGGNAEPDREKIAFIQCLKEKDVEIHALNYEISLLKGKEQDFITALKEKDALIATLKAENQRVSGEFLRVSGELSAKVREFAENEALKKLFLEHYHNYLAIIQEKPAEFGDFSSKTIEFSTKNIDLLTKTLNLSEIKQKLNEIIKNFSKNLHENMSSQLIFSRHKHEKSALDSEIQETLAKNLVLTNENLKLSTNLREKDNQIYEMSLKNNVLLTENENLKSSLRVLSQDSENLRKNNENLQKFAAFETDLLSLRRELEASELKFLEKLKENEALRRSLADLEANCAEKVKKAAKTREDSESLSELQRELAHFKSENTAKEGLIAEISREIESLQHQNTLLSYEIESLRASLSAKAEREAQQTDLLSQKNEEIVSLKGFLAKYEAIAEDLAMEKRKVAEYVEKEHVFSKEIQILKKELAEKREILEKYPGVLKENERLHALLSGKNEDFRRFNVEISELQREIERNRELSKNYNELKVILESFKAEKETLLENHYRIKEELAVSKEQNAKIGEENASFREKSSEIERINQANLKRIVDLEGNLSKVLFENDKLKSLMYERLKEIESLKKKIAEISTFYEENALNAKEKFEDVLRNFVVNIIIVVFFLIK